LNLHYEQDRETIVQEKLENIFHKSRVWPEQKRDKLKRLIIIDELLAFQSFIPILANIISLLGKRGVGCLAWQVIFINELQCCADSCNVVIKCKFSRSS
jgi:hypothetical protein